MLGEEHPATLVSKFCLANVYNALGRSGEALALYESCLETQKRVLGEEHPAAF